MRRRPTQAVAGRGFVATAKRATRQFQATEEGQHVCRPFFMHDAGRRIEIYCSATGKSLRVFSRGKGEMRTLDKAGQE